MTQKLKLDPSSKQRCPKTGMTVTLQRLRQRDHHEVRPQNNKVKQENPRHRGLWGVKVCTTGDGAVAWLVEHLPSIHKALGSVLSIV